jgi:hypothetical protein
MPLADPREIPNLISKLIGSLDFVVLLFIHKPPVYSLERNVEIGEVYC